MEGISYEDTNQVTFDVPMEDTDDSCNTSVVSSPGPGRFYFNNEEDFFHQVEEDHPGTITELSLVSGGRTFSYLALGNVSEWDHSPVAEDDDAASPDSEAIAQSGTMPGDTLVARNTNIPIPRHLQHLYLHQWCLSSGKKGPKRQSKSYSVSLQWELGIGSELSRAPNGGNFYSNEFLISEEPDYNRKRFAFAEPHVKIVKDERFDRSLLAAKTPSLDQFIANCLSRSILQGTSVRWRLQKRRNHSKMGVQPTPDLRWVILSFATMPLRLPQDSQPHCSQSLRLRHLLPKHISQPAPEGEITILIRRLEAVLQRMETIEFPHRKAMEMFILALINRIIRHAEPALSIKANMTQVPLLRNRKTHVAIQTDLHCFDFARINAEGFYYQKSLSINLNEIRPDSHISIPYSDRYLMDSGANPAEWGIRRWGVPKKAVDLIAQISISLDGFFGTSTELELLIRELKNRHTGEIKPGDAVCCAVGIKQSLFGFRATSFSSYLKPNNPISASIPNMPLILMRSNLVSRWLPVISGVLDSYQSGQPL